MFISISDGDEAMKPNLTKPTGSNLTVHKSNSQINHAKKEAEWRYSECKNIVFEPSEL